MNHEEWLAWRRQGIGSSDAPIIMGVSPYSTPYQLWEEKLGRVKPERNTFILDKGHRLEPMARALIEFELGQNFPPKLVVHESEPWLRASLDGMSELGDIIEIKYMGAEEHASGQIPERYLPQVQHQMVITGVAKVYFCSFNPDAETKLRIIEVPRDDKYLAEYLVKAAEFWNYVTEATPPPLGPKDSKRIRDNHLISLGNRYAEIDAEIKKLGEEQEGIKKQLLESDKIASHPKVECGRLQIDRIQRAGNINYKAVPELKGVDLEKYRGKPVIYSKITVKS